jgi:hypothetical protein
MKTILILYCRQPLKTDIVMPVKSEAEPIIAIVEPVAALPIEVASSEMLTEEETDALNQISQRYIIFRRVSLPIYLLILIVLLAVVKPQKTVVIVYQFFFERIYLNIQCP